MGDDPNTTITEIDAALLSAITSLIEIMISEKTTKEKNIASLFESQCEGFLSKKMFAAAGIMEHLRLWTLNPDRKSERQKEQQRILDFLNIPPKGSA